jgi:nucleotide-binding universal stress UspA family protein
MKGYKNVVIAVNGKIDVLKEGLDLIRDEKCKVTVVKVVPSYEGDLSLVGVKNINDTINGGPEKLMEAIKDFSADSGTSINARIEEGEIDKKIVDVATEEKCDLIIVGKGKKNLLKKMLGQNYAEKVMDKAPCKVVEVATK